MKKRETGVKEREKIELARKLMYWKESDTTRKWINPQQSSADNALKEVGIGVHITCSQCRQLYKDMIKQGIYETGWHGRYNEKH